MTTFDLKMCGLELDGRFHLPSANPMAEPEEKCPYYSPDGLQVSYVQEAASAQTKRVCGLHSTTFVLSVAFPSVTLLEL